MIDKLKSMDPTQRFVYFVTEREAIRRLREEAGDPNPPWTTDPILSKYRFCNVRRMDDKVSRWLMENWYKPNSGHPNMLLAVVLARHLNKPECLEEIGFPVTWSPKHIKDVVRRRMAHGLPTWSSAYMVRGIGTADKIEMVVDKVCQPLIDNPPSIDINSMERSWSALLPYWGFSSFMAGQVVADLRFATPQGAWLDKNIWAPVGPGSARGLARLIHPNDHAKAAAGYANHQANWLMMFQEHVLNGVRLKFQFSIRERLEAMDWQNCLCEFDKWERALWGEGKPKQLYRPGKS